MRFNRGVVIASWKLFPIPRDEVPRGPIRNIWKALRGRVNFKLNNLLTSTRTNLVNPSVSIYLPTYPTTTFSVSPSPPPSLLPLSHLILHSPHPPQLTQPASTYSSATTFSPNTSTTSIQTRPPQPHTNHMFALYSIQLNHLTTRLLLFRCTPHSSTLFNPTPRATKNLVIQLIPRMSLSYFSIIIPNPPTLALFTQIHNENHVFFSTRMSQDPHQISHFHATRKTPSSRIFPRKRQ